jgi:alkylation response protein AidB-like acyl-CoA dehydrogenase
MPFSNAVLDMSQTLPDQQPDDVSQLEIIADISRQQLAPMAVEIDEGLYPLEMMSELGKAGAFGFHLADSGHRFDRAIQAMETISEACGSTGFLTWCHDVMGLYLDQSDNVGLRQRLLPGHSVAQTLGGTALSNPMKSFAGIEPILLKAKPVAGGYSVSGSLPWVSHIAPGQYCAAIAQIEVESAEEPREVMFLLPFDGRAKLRPCPKFSGMEGTSTWGITLEDFFVPTDDIIADPVKPFVARIRAAFILLQTGMALGVAKGAIADIRSVQGHLGHVNQYLADGADDLKLELDELRARIMTLAVTPFDKSRDYLVDVLDARAEGAELCLRAAQSALLHQGARGYLMTSAPQRRIRESHFVAIVTPAIKHLRRLMAQLERDPSPAMEQAR